MREILLPALRLFGLLTILTGVGYPLVVTAIGYAFFRESAGGSLIRCDGTVAGSALLAQKFTSRRYFWPRPSAADFLTVPSGASNSGPVSKVLQASVAKRRSTIGTDAPDDLLTSSGSGLDPHVSPRAARFQATRVALARGLAISRVNSVIESHLERPQLGILGEPRINVLLLNLALDELQ